MRTKFFAVVVLAVLSGACAIAKPAAPKTLVCQSSPQWFTNDAKGIPSAAVFICFREDGVLVYQSRPLTADEIKAMTTPAAPVKQPRDPKMGRFTKQKGITAPTQPGFVAPAVNASVPLPTLGGTAK